MELSIQIETAKNKIQAVKTFNYKMDKRNAVQHKMVCMLNEATVRGATLVKQAKQKAKE